MVYLVNKLTFNKRVYARVELSYFFLYKSSQPNSPRDRSHPENAVRESSIQDESVEHVNFILYESCMPNNCLIPIPRLQHACRSTKKDIVFLKMCSSGYVSQENSN